MPNLRAKSPLQIHATPFKPSFLSIPPSPCSPRTPLTPPPRPASHSHTSHCSASNPTSFTSSSATSTTVAPPTTPLAWTWTCHQCRRTYHLSVTRRCLEDGHMFCSGTTTVKTWRKGSGAARHKVKRHRACGSEFDYAGWKVWGRWRRGGGRERGSRRIGGGKGGEKDCWGSCDYPSECRWGKRFGVHTTVELEAPEVGVDSDEVKDGNGNVHGHDVLPTLNRTVENLDKLEKCSGVRMSEDADKNGIWSALVASAERRKSGSSLASSPLATVVEEELEQLGGECTSLTSLRNSDGDEVMTTIDPSLLTVHNEPSSIMDSAVLVSTRTASSVGTAGHTAVDSLRALISRKRIRRTRSSRFIPGIAESAYAELEGSAPLQRVSSRDSGYHSTMDVV